MNSDQDSPRSRPGGLPGQCTEVDVSATVRSDGGGTTTFTYSFEVDPWAQSFTFEHDKGKGVFRLTDAEGKAEYFRDKPARYLVVCRYAYCSPYRKRDQPFNPAPMLGRKTD